MIVEIGGIYLDLRAIQMIDVNDKALFLSSGVRCSVNDPEKWAATWVENMKGQDEKTLRTLRKFAREQAKEVRDVLEPPEEWQE